jgi:hypothetical protein
MFPVVLFPAAGELCAIGKLIDPTVELGPA